MHPRPPVRARFLVPDRADQEPRLQDIRAWHAVVAVSGAERHAQAVRGEGRGGRREASPSCPDRWTQSFRTPPRSPSPPRWPSRKRFARNTRQSSHNYSKNYAPRWFNGIGSAFILHQKLNWSRLAHSPVPPIWAPRRPQRPAQAKCQGDLATSWPGFVSVATIAVTGQPE